MRTTIEAQEDALKPIMLAAPELMTALELNVFLQQPCMVWGPPGIGKSSVYAQLATKLDIALKDVRAMLMNPVDVNGMPHKRFGDEAAMKLYRLSQILNADQVDYNEVRALVLSSSPADKLKAITTILTEDKKNTFSDWRKMREIVGDAADDYFGETIWSRPGILPKVGRGILLFDELNAGAPDVQAAMYQPMLDRRIGEHILGLGWVIMAAGNRLADRAVVRPMPTPLIDRLQHYFMAVQFEAWQDWANAKHIHPLIIAYLQYSMKPDRAYANDPNRVGMLLNFNPKKGDQDPFETPRSWEKVSNAMYEMDARGLTGTDIEIATIAGKVSRAAADEMLDFARVWREGLTIPVIMANPARTKLPEKGAMKSTVCAALARQTTPDNIADVWKYISRMEQEYQMAYVIYARQQDEKLNETRIITEFMADHAELV